MRLITKVSRVAGLLASALLATVVAGASVNYTGPDGGNWNTDGNWSLGFVPVNGDDATLPGRYTLLGGESYSVNYDGNYEQPGLRALTIDGSTPFIFPNSTTLLQAGSNMVANAETVGATTGEGVYTQTGGSNQVNGNDGLLLGYYGGAAGTYNLGGTGTLTVTQGTEVVGTGGMGTFNQTGGSNMTPALFLGSAGNGTYNLSGGTLIVSDERVGLSGIGAFTQTGGTHIVRSLSINGPYTLSNTGVLQAADEFIAVNGSGGFGGTFTQAGGTHTVTGTLQVGRGIFVTVYGTYVLQSGSLTAATVLLDAGGTFTMTGGTLNATNFHQNGGSVYGTLQNQGTFTYDAGTFGGTLLNQGTVTLNADFTAGNGMENDTLLTIPAGRSIALDPPGLLNTGTLILAGKSATAAATANDGTILQTAGSSFLGALFGAGTVTVGSASGSPAMMNVDYFHQYSVRVNSTGTLAVAAHSPAASNTTGTLAIAAGGKLDLSNSSLQINYGGASPIFAVRAELTTGYAGGAWNGPGIDTSTADGCHELGYADSADGVVKNLPPGTVLVKYTVSGDADLDGKVDFNDLVILARHYNQSNANWDQGDFNYDGTVGFDDLVSLARDYGKSVSAVQMAGFSPAFAADVEAAFGQVPEPRCAAMMAAALLTLLGRRRSPIRPIGIRCALMYNAVLNSDQTGN